MMTTSETTAAEPRWLELLRDEAGRSSIAAAAVRLSYSRTTISLVLSGTYPGSTDKIAAKAIEMLEPVLTVECPFLRETISVGKCAEHATERAPTHHPTKMSHWRQCVQCPNRGKGTTT